MLNAWTRQMRRIAARIKNYGHSSTFSYRIWLPLVYFRSFIGNHPKPIKILLASDGRDYTSEQQFAPMYRFAGVLRRRVGVVFQHLTIEAATAMTSRRLRKFDMIGLKLSFRTPEEEAQQIVSHFRSALTEGGTRLAYFDGDDDSSVQWPSVLHTVDAYFKKHVFSNVSEHMTHRIGKSNLTDYVAHRFGFSFADNLIPRSGGIPAADVQKIKLSWNVALDDYVIDLHRELSDSPPMKRDIDVLCRANVASSSWTYPLRNAAIESIETLSKRYTVHVPRDRVSRREFLQEMLRAKICVSPFGYGEICWRDFESIACGALLLKPDMSHIQTLPDLFVPNVTFVPVKWDYSDLEKKSDYYLRDNAARRRITTEAQRRLIECQSADWFVDAFRSLLASAGAVSQIHL